MAIQVNPEEQFHIVRNGTVMTVSLEELDASYQRDSIADETLIWQEGLVEWMRLDTLLHTLEQQDGPVAPAPAPSPEVYYVLVAPEEVKQMSLDLLADAYRLDVIDDETLIWQPGYTEWIPLAALLGTDNEHVSIGPGIPDAAVVMPSNMGAHLTFEDSLAPAALWIPPEPPRASPWYGRTLTAVALVGALFVAYRNGAGDVAAEEFGQRPLLAKLEAKVGTPGVDTVHGLERLLTDLTGTHGLSHLSETDPIPTQNPVKAHESDKGEDDVEKGATDAAPKAAAETAAPTEVAVPRSNDKDAAAFTSSLTGKAQEARIAPRKPQKVKNSLPKKWRGADPNDPMNGSL